GKVCARCSRRDEASPAALTSIAEHAPARGGFSSMQTRPLEETVALARLYAQLHRVAVAEDCERHFDAGLALRPDAAKEAGEIAHFAAGDGKHDVPGAQVGALGRSAVGEADDDEPVLHLGREQAEPGLPRGGEQAEQGPRRRVAPAELREVVENRLQQVDRHDHVDVLRLPLLDGMLQLQRADAEPDNPGAYSPRV